MGSGILGQSIFNPSVFGGPGNLPTGGPKAAPPPKPAEGTKLAARDVFAKGGNSSDTTALEFQRTFQRLAVAFEFQQASAQATQTNSEDGTSTDVSASAEQLSFSFFFEAQSEQVSLFRERTDAVADGQTGAQRESFLATRERIAVRFQFNASITTSALNGFAGSAEKAASDPAALQSLTGLADSALDEDTLDFFNKIFGLFDDFLKGEGDIEERFAQLLTGLEELGIIPPGFADQLGAPSGDGTGTSVTAQSQRVSFQFEFEFESESVSVQKSDPIVLDLDGDGVELTSYKNGANFDITGQGRLAQTAFVTGGDAFLALDRNNNGRVDNGAELFGDQRGARNGFEELRKLDSNGDNIIDAKDPVYELLRLFKDDGNGRTDKGELISLREAGIESISLAYENVDVRATGGNRLSQIAAFQRTDGTKGTAADAILNYVV